MAVISHEHQAMHELLKKTQAIAIKYLPLNIKSTVMKNMNLNLNWQLNPYKVGTKLKALFAICLLFFASCGTKETASDPKTQLTTLKAQRDKLNTDISALELKLNGGKKKERINYVSTTAVKTTNFTHSIDLQGSVVADDEVYVNAKMMGAITSVMIKVGDKVKAGQVVATIDDDIMVTQMDEIRKRMELANELYTKQEALWKQNIGSEVAYLSAKNQKESLEKSLATANKTRENFQIKAPITGIVDEVPMKIGMSASPGVPLAKIVNFSKLKVRVDAPESYAGKLRVGNSVVANFPDLKKDISSRISYVGASVSPLNRTFKVEIPLKSNETGLIPNMASTVKVIDYANPNAIVIPINVIQRDDKNADFVIVADNGHAKKVFIKTGQSYSDGIEVLSGLKSGDNLITVGFQDLNDGDVLQIN